jgi:predicted nucleotidyltransferase component of viral defense system
MPAVAAETCFAIHGGTAINLFITDMNRLSVDIDLTYVPLENRADSLAHINEALLRISEQVKKYIKGIHIIPRLDICKLTCEYHGCQVKIEVNQTKRGIVGGEVLRLPLCEKAQEEFGVELEANIVPLTLLYGGKMAAALSRQHPRDLFDIRYMKIPLQEAKYGFVFCLLGSDRPLHESFSPHIIDQRQAMEKQFEGMSNIPFTYAEFEETRQTLISQVKELFDKREKEFLINFESGNPDWSRSPYKEFELYPSIQWKQKNILKLKHDNPDKLEEEAERLRVALDV